MSSAGRADCTTTSSASQRTLCGLLHWSSQYHCYCYLLDIKIGLTLKVSDGLANKPHLSYQPEKLEFHTHASSAVLCRVGCGWPGLARLWHAIRGFIFCYALCFLSRICSICMCILSLPLCCTRLSYLFKASRHSGKRTPTLRSMYLLVEIPSNTQRAHVSFSNLA